MSTDHTEERGDGLAVRDVTVRYARRLPPAVHGISLDVARREIVALTGPSGCGKSTILRAIAGLEPMESGTVSWAGQDLRSVPPHRRNFGLLFQDGQLFAHMTVAKNIAYGLAARGASRASREARVAELLETVGLPEHGDRAITELSGGERQRVALARSLAPKPRLLLLDEPLSALDRELRERLAVDLKRMLREAEMTAILVTHDHSEADVIADRTLSMRAGKLIA